MVCRGNFGINKPRNTQRNKENEIKYCLEQNFYLYFYIYVAIYIPYIYIYIYILYYIGNKGIVERTHSVLYNFSLREGSNRICSYLRIHPNSPPAPPLFLFSTVYLGIGMINVFYFLQEIH